VSVRTRKGIDLGPKPIEEFIKLVSEEIKNKTL